MINEEQLKRWAQAPSPTEMERIKNARNIIEDAIKKYFPVAEIKKKHSLSSFELPRIYLQGSYANSTNIKFDSDIDIVVQINEAFFSDTTQLSEEEKQIYKLEHRDSNYSCLELKNDIFNALQMRFGSTVKYTDKCLKVEENTNRIKADVIPCFQYKLYKKYISLNNEDYIGGIKFMNTNNNTEIINFPEIHLKNCESKNIDTDGNYKSMVRIFKNLKSVLVEKHLMNDKIAPVYFIENLLYNCSSQCFDGSFSECMIKILQFLFDAFKTKRISGFICANEQNSLFSEKT